MSQIAFAPRPSFQMSAPAVRLTRRGRLALTTLFLVVLLLGAVSLGGGSVASSERGEAVSVATVVVKPGDTLWEIASVNAEPGETRDMIHRIQQLNALSDAGLQVGQRLAVPLS